MQRKFLEELGIDKDTIDKIMTENGRDIESAKQKLTAERDGLQSQLTAAQDALKGFEGVDVAQLKEKISTLTADLAAKDAAHKQQLADMGFQSLLDTALSGSKARNAKAVTALLDVETLKASKNQSEDIQTAIAKCREENAFLFASDEPIQNPVHDTGGTPKTGNPMSAIRAAMGLKTES